MHHINDVTVSRQRRVRRATDAGQVNGRRVIDAVAYSWTLQRRSIGSKAEWRHDKECRDRSRTRIDISIFTNFALAGCDTAWRGFAEEISSIKELNGLTVQPTSSKAIFVSCGALHGMVHNRLMRGVGISRRPSEGDQQTEA